MHPFVTTSLGLQNIGQCQTFTMDDLPDPAEWGMTVRFLESQGLSVMGANSHTKNGYIADDYNQCEHWNGTDKYSEVIVTKVGIPLVSEKPQKPRTEEKGLKFVPTFAMGVIVGDRNHETDFYAPAQVIPSSRLALQVANTSGIQYGQSGFEGACAMRQGDDVFLFRLPQLAERFRKTCEALLLPPLDKDAFIDTVTQVVQANKAYVPLDGKLYIRPSVCGGQGGLGIIAPDTVYITIEVAAFGDYLPSSIELEGRLDIARPATGADKIAPNYGGSFLIKDGVKSRGYADYLSFDSTGHAEEVSTCAIAFLQKKKEGGFRYIFPKVRGDGHTAEENTLLHALPSVTRLSIIEMLRALGKEVELRPVHHTEIPDCDGLFTMGNAVGVLRVSKIDIKKNPADPNSQLVIFDNSDANDEIDRLRDLAYRARMGRLEAPELLDFNTQWIIKV